MDRIRLGDIATLINGDRGKSLYETQKLFDSLMQEYFG